MGSGIDPAGQALAILPDEKGRRVELVDDHRDRYGNLFRAGQRGVVHLSLDDGFKLIDFDGFEEERSAAEFEDSGATPWLGMIPITKLLMLDC